MCTPSEVIILSYLSCTKRISQGKNSGTLEAIDILSHFIKPLLKLNRSPERLDCIDWNEWKSEEVISGECGEWAEYQLFLNWFYNFCPAVIHVVESACCVYCPVRVVFVSKIISNVLVVVDNDHR